MDEVDKVEDWAGSEALLSWVSFRNLEIVITKKSTFFFYLGI